MQSQSPPYPNPHRRYATSLRHSHRFGPSLPQLMVLRPLLALTLGPMSCLHLPSLTGEHRIMSPLRRPTVGPQMGKHIHVPDRAVARGGGRQVRKTASLMHARLRRLHRRRGHPEAAFASTLLPVSHRQHHRMTPRFPMRYALPLPRRLLAWTPKQWRRVIAGRKHGLTPVCLKRNCPSSLQSKQLWLIGWVEHVIAV
mmetsp:Transcript_9513/g.27301  ORF Transcript_9513/g.27301 Transcript_9513/m.27301 type:complete len:198 (-) Transcript_9513:413-1006(-)